MHKIFCWNYFQRPRFLQIQRGTGQRRIRYIIRKFTRNSCKNQVRVFESIINQEIVIEFRNYLYEFYNNRNDVRVV